MSFSRIFVPLLVLVATACGGVEGSETGADVETGVGDLALTAADGAVAWAETAAYASPGLELDPDLTLDDLAFETMSTGYRRRSPCATRTRSHGTLRIDFGSGCTYGPWTLSGALALTAAQGPSSRDLTVVYEGLSGGARTLTGTVTISTDRPLRTRAVAGELTVATATSSTDLLYAGTAQVANGVVTVDGTASREDGATQSDLTVDEVELAFGDCYPSAGSVTLDRTGEPTTTVTFSSQTPVTGEVEVTVGRLPTQTVTLPPCP